MKLTLLAVFFVFSFSNLVAQTKIKCQASADSTKNPLYILDGEALDNKKSNEIFKNLDPQTIQQINVYKGAEAQALYGLKGVNGVVVITTKKEKSKTKN